MKGGYQIACYVQKAPRQGKTYLDHIFFVDKGLGEGLLEEGLAHDLQVPTETAKKVIEEKT